MRPCLGWDAEPEVELAERAAWSERVGVADERRLEMLEGLFHGTGARIREPEHGAGWNVIRIECEGVLEEVDGLAHVPALECALAYLHATFSGEPRHRRRLDKVLAIERATIEGR